MCRTCPPAALNQHRRNSVCRAGKFGGSVNVIFIMTVFCDSSYRRRQRFFAAERRDTLRTVTHVLFVLSPGRADPFSGHGYRYRSTNWRAFLFRFSTSVAAPDNCNASCGQVATSGLNNTYWIATCQFSMPPITVAASQGCDNPAARRQTWRAAGCQRFAGDDQHGFALTAATNRQHLRMLNFFLSVAEAFPVLVTSREFGVYTYCRSSTSVAYSG